MSYYNSNGSGKEIPSNVNDFIDKFIYQVKKFWWLPLVLVFIFSSCFCIREKKNFTTMYTAYTTFIIEVENDYNYYYSGATAMKLEETFPYIITSEVLQNVVAEDLGLSSIPGSISAEALEGTGLFTIKVRSHDPKMAYDVLNSVIKNYPSVVSFVLGDTELKILDESGVPTSPSNSLDFTTAIEKGVMVGLILGIGFMLIMAITRQTVCSRDELKQLLSVRCLGVVPEMSLKKRSVNKENKPLVSNRHINHGFVESFRNIRTRVEKTMGEKNTKTVMITSSVADEGKTTFCANLALSLSQLGKRVIILDCDMRNPTVNALFDLEKEEGMPDLIDGKKPVKDILQRIDGTSILAVAGKKNVTNPYDYLGSQNFAAIVEEMKKYADYVIIDSPPSSLFNDAAVIARHVDEIIYVVRWNYSKKYHIIEGVQQLIEANGKVMGCVLNRSTGVISNHQYGHYYGNSKYYGTGRFDR